jgi:hypothetical protein
MNPTESFIDFSYHKKLNKNQDDDNDEIMQKILPS